MYLCILGELRSKKVKGQESSVLFSDLDPSQQYGAYVLAVTRSNTMSRQSEFVIGKPYSK